MAVSKWVYRKSDDVFLYGGFYEAVPPVAGDPPVPDYDNFGVVEFPDADPHPDVVLHRFDATEGKRPATAQELGADVTAALDASSHLSSRQKDVLTTCALIVRARGIPAWNAMTVQQKVSATFAEADVWKAMRIWAETNL